MWPERLIGDALVVCIGCLLMGVFLNGLSCYPVYGTQVHVGHTASSFIGSAHYVDSIYQARAGELV